MNCVGSKTAYQSNYFRIINLLSITSFHQKFGYNLLYWATEQFQIVHRIGAVLLLSPWNKSNRLVKQNVVLMFKYKITRTDGFRYFHFFFFKLIVKYFFWFASFNNENLKQTRKTFSQYFIGTWFKSDWEFWDFCEVFCTLHDFLN